MLKKSFIISALVLALGVRIVAQNANTPASQPPARRPVTTQKPTTTTTTTTPAPTPTPQTGATPAPNNTRTRRATRPGRAAASAAEQEVRATFDALLRAVEKRDVDA